MLKDLFSKFREYRTPITGTAMIAALPGIIPTLFYAYSQALIAVMISIATAGTIIVVHWNINNTTRLPAVVQSPRALPYMPAPEVADTHWRVESIHPVREPSRVAIAMNAAIEDVVDAELVGESN